MSFDSFTTGGLRRCKGGDNNVYKADIPVFLERLPEESGVDCEGDD
jgi:hypothetical protein